METVVAGIFIEAALCRSHVHIPAANFSRSSKHSSTLNLKTLPSFGGEDCGTLQSIPSIRDRVVQGALKLILEPIFEADFQPGSFGYRPKRTAHEAVARVAQGIVEEKTRIIDLDLTAYFDRAQHSLLLEKVARRVR